MRFTGVDENLENLAKTERQMMYIRGLVILALAAALFANHDIPDKTAAYLILAVAGLYAAGSIVLIQRQTFPITLISPASTAIDIALVSALIFFSGGLESDLYLIYFLVIISLVYRFNWWQSVAWTLISASSYSGIVIAGSPGLSLPLDARLLYRGAFLLLIAGFTISLAYTRQVHQEEAISDSLTGIYNRRYLRERLEEELARSRRFGLPASISLLDIDHFKKCNDLYGHLVGDQVLKGVATLISSSIRKIDLVARYGGEEFVIIMPQTDASGALILAEKIRKLIARHRFSTASGESFSITVSQGVATVPQDALGRREMLTEADAALYRAKQRGRNRVCQAEPLRQLGRKTAHKL